MTRRPSIQRSVQRPATVAILAALACAWAAMGLPAAAQQKNSAQDDLAQRMAVMEQRILDMQTVIGTLQSFVQGGGAAAASGGLPGPGGAPAPGGPNEDSVRVLALETQIRALTAQVKQLSQRLDQSGASSAPAPVPAPPPATSPGQAGGTESGSDLPPWRQQPAPRQQGTPGGTPYPGAAQQPPSQDNPFAAQLSGSGGQQTSALPPLPGLGGNTGSARGLYDASYENYLRSDMKTAEEGFRQFVQTYPDNELVSNAYYWLGRTHFDRNQYEPAAKAFLAGYKKNKKGAVAPDSLLHLGMSLAQLGEKDAACSTLGAIDKQYPDAPDQLMKNANSALKKAGC